MKRPAISTIIAVVVALMMPHAVEAYSRKAEKIANRYLKAMGGKKLRAITSMKMTGTVGMAGFEAPFVLLLKRPGRSRMDLTILGRDIVQAYDGEKAWWINPLLGAPTPQEMPEDFARQLMIYTEMDNPLVDYRRKRLHLDYVGEENTTHVIEIRTREGAVVRVSIDKESNLEVKRSYEQTYRGKTRRVETYFADYMEVDGIMVPRTIRGVDFRGEPYLMSTEAWEFDPDIDDAVFEMP